MRTFEEGLNLIRQALITTGLKVYYLKMPTDPKEDFIIFNVVSDNPLYGDGESQIRTIEGAIEIYTKDLKFTNIPVIEDALKNSRIRFRYKWSDYDSGLDCMHHSYSWEV